MREILKTFASQAGLLPPSFTNWDFTTFSDKKACASVIEYFTKSVPDATLDFGHLRVLSPIHLQQENTELIPGCETSPHGIITIAATDSGDSIGVDIASGIVYLVDHAKFEDDMISMGWKPDMSGFLDPIPITHDNIILVCEVHWPDIRSATISILENPDLDNGAPVL